MNISKIKISDTLLISQIFTIEQETFSRPWSYENISFEIANNHSLCYMLINGNQLSGYLFAVRMIDEIQINKICIIEPARRKGLGFLFLSEFLTSEFTNDITSVFLEVNLNNIPAVNLYKKAGFKINRIRHKIYDARDDGAEMVLVHPY